MKVCIEQLYFALVCLEKGVSLAYYYLSDQPARQQRRLALPFPTFRLPKASSQPSGMQGAATDRNLIQFIPTETNSLLGFQKSTGEN